MTVSSYSVHSVYKSILDSFHQYLSAQYHIWDEHLIAERERIFAEVGNTAQEPRLEATPQYASGKPYSELEIPSEAVSILNCAAADGTTGIPQTAYTHQCRAVEKFFAGKELIVATGTGSGKTESFLIPILSSLATESVQRLNSWSTPGVRAILLYPMNALVNDQLSRLRRLLGNENVLAKFGEGKRRIATFGMYTSRSPYPGRRTSRKDKERVVGEINKLYIDGMTKEYRDLLKEEGKWPAKDLEAFVDSGLNRGLMDAELMTRHEMQDNAPDIIVTNYSMLEYMMLRPLEAPIFEQTAAWLAADAQNQLTIVIDEAHMYRGSGGAEVAYLLRRLQARLGVSRERLRFILTSASLGSSEGAENDIKEFAEKLTGGKMSDFELIKGDLNIRSGGQSAAAGTSKVLASFDRTAILGSHDDLAKAHASLCALGAQLGSSAPRPGMERGELQHYVYSVLESLPVASLVAEMLTNKPMAISECARLAFPHSHDSAEALESLLALMAFAYDHINRRPFCPVRSHLFFRGLPGLYVCTNSECGSSGAEGPRTLGKLHAAEKLRCDCGSRVYELLTHRSCGASYLRAYTKGADGDFLWHQSSNGTWTETRLVESQFYVIPESQAGDIRGTTVWLHTPTGKLLSTEPASGAPGPFLRLMRPDFKSSDRGREVISLKNECPACGQRPQPESPVAMDLATKGEAPFAHIVRSQVSSQPAVKRQTRQTPNGGRKTIIFSDGRQKAARLAREIPRELELDVFRQAMFMAAQSMEELGRDPRLNEHLYIAFLKCMLDHNLCFFDGNDRATLERHVDDFQHFHDGDLRSQLDDGSVMPPPSYWAILLKQLGAPFYSVSSLTLGYAAPVRKAVSPRIYRELQGLHVGEVDAMAAAWIQRLLSRFAFAADIPDGVRSSASRYPIKASVARDGFSKVHRQILSKNGVDADTIEKCFARNLCDTKPDGSIYLKPSHLMLRSALTEKWVQCSSCRSVSPSLIFGSCPSCGSTSAMLVDPESSGYLRARKGFWRDPVAMAIGGKAVPLSLDVQEHSAQLSYKDADNPSPTTEIFERRFRDILKGGERAVDVLSCTTTMEVGIDIGSLIAVSMRNVPPMRQNYQQRAGRSGRRGSAVSTVVTYAQTGAHDSYYFKKPDKILAGDPPKPVLDTSNTRITDRHVLSQLLQDFFRPLAAGSSSGDIYTVLGDTWNFYHAESPSGLAAFIDWVWNSDEGKGSIERAQAWLPDGQCAETVARSMIGELLEKRPATEEGLESRLIDYLFARGLLPSYAFPVDLCALQIQEKVPSGGYRVVEQAQQGLNVALSEYAPGRLVVVDKKTYRIGTVASSGPESELDRGAPLFSRSKVYRHCEQCSYTAGFIGMDDGEQMCPQCASVTLRTMTVIRPEMVFPSGRTDISDFEDQVYSRVTKAQLPLPEKDRKLATERFGRRSGIAYMPKQRLIVVNEGDPGAAEVGFRVCQRCGKVLAQGDAEGPHWRDYFTSSSDPSRSKRCDGEFRQVFLGYEFTSDVLLVRIDVVEPMRFDLHKRRDRKPLEDALQTLCEALTLSMSRVLDIDVREVSAGFRFGSDGDSKFADIFVYDNLSGGAGYALEAGQSFDKIFQDTRRVLADCNCSASCENCLRQYTNRFSHADLDRNLALDLANYIESGSIPGALTEEAQVGTLEPLIEMLRLAGGEVEVGAGGVIASHAGKSYQLEVCPSLRSCVHREWINGVIKLVFSPYEIQRDLPSAFAEMN